MKLRTLGRLYLLAMGTAMRLAGDLNQFANTRTRRLAVLAVLLFLLDVVSLGRVNGWLVLGLVLAAVASWLFDRYRR